MNNSEVQRRSQALTTYEHAFSSLFSLKQMLDGFVKSHQHRHSGVSRSL